VNLLADQREARNRESREATSKAYAVDAQPHLTLPTIKHTPGGKL